MDWIFRTETGKTIDPNDVIFPLTSYDTPGAPFRVIGTAFLIAKPSIFLTSRHCLFKDDEQTVPWRDLVGIRHHGLPIEWVTYIDQTDVAIGQLQMPEGGCEECSNHRVLTLCTFSPIEKERICHWGCDLSEIKPNELDPETYHLCCRSAVRGYSGHFIEKLPLHPPFTHSETYITSASLPHARNGGRS